MSSARTALPKAKSSAGIIEQSRLPFLLALSVYDFLLNEENYLSAFISMIILIYSEVWKHTEREGRRLCEGNHYSAEMRLSAASKAETLFSSLQLPPLSSGLKKMEF